MVEVSVRLSDNSEAAGVVARVDFLEPTDHFGTTAVLKYIDGNDNYMSSWARDFMLGGESPDGGVVHFCRAENCRAVSDGKTMVHTTRWKLLPPKPPTPGVGSAGGLGIFGGGSSQARMRGVDEARRESGDVSAGAARPAVGGQRAALPQGTRPFPPLPPPGHDAGASRDKPERESAGAKRPTMDEVLRDRAAARARNVQAEQERNHGEHESRRRRRGRRSERSPSGSDSSSAPVFRGAPTIFKGSKFMQAAVKREGTLLENGVMMMRKALAARQGGGGLTSEMTEQLTQLQGVVTNYLTVGLSPSAASQGKPLGMRNEREMRTLAESLDALLTGDLGRAGDILMQRFRACEVNVLEGDWNMAKHLELIPAHQITCVPIGMRQEMQREKRLADKLSSGQNSGRRRSGEDPG